MEAFTGINRKIESLWGWRNSFPFFNLDCFIYGKLLYYKQDAKKGVKLMDTHDIVLGFSRQVKDILGDKLSKVILYGSYARGDYRENSDIDIMVLTTLTDDQIMQIKTDIYDLAFDFQMEYGVDISVIMKNEEHFNYWLGALPFYDNVQREGIVLNG